MKPTKEEQAILDAFRSGPCEICGRRGPTDAAHIMSRGAGVANLQCNLVSLCRVCHSLNHGGGIHPHVLLCIAAIREGMTIDAIREAVWAERRRRLKEK